jgi:hypothetical protein
LKTSKRALGYLSKRMEQNIEEITLFPKEKAIDMENLKFTKTVF